MDSLWAWVGAPVTSPGQRQDVRELGHKSLVVVFQIDIANLPLCGVNPKRQSAIAGYSKAPSPCPVSLEQVRLPRGQGMQLGRVLHLVQEGQHLAKLVGQVGRNTLGNVLLI